MLLRNELMGDDGQGGSNEQLPTNGLASSTPPRNLFHYSSSPTKSAGSSSEL